MNQCQGHTQYRFSREYPIKPREPSRGQVVRETESLVIAEISDFRATPEALGLFRLSKNIFGTILVNPDPLRSHMPGFPSIGGGSSDGKDLFGEYDEFDPGYIPEPGWFLTDHSVLTGEDHVAFHRVTKEIFDDRGVYDMTFGYNLARLNLDTRHPDAGYRYAEQDDDPSVLRAEFTPTTEFCPQSDTLTKGSFRAWNDLSDHHEYDLVRVRVDRMHHRASEINAALEELEEQYGETGNVTHVADDGGEGPTRSPGCSSDSGSTSRGYGPDAPF